MVTSYRDGGVTRRPRLIRAAFRLEWLTVGWIVVEAAVALASGVSAGSISLTAFGLDSLIELSAVPGFPLSEAVIQSVLAPGQMHLLFGANGDDDPPGCANSPRNWITASFAGMTNNLLVFRDLFSADD